MLLFHALVGRPPFTGGRLAVLSRKTEQEAPDPSTLLAGVPEDLAYLCTRLLCRDPAQRLGGPEVLRFLGVVPAARVTSEASRPLVGREGPLRALEEALARTRETGGARAVLVQGPSGMGKSTLVRHFCAKAEETQGALVFSGRCYEHESVPYKAADGVVDALTHHLGRLDATQRAAVLPRISPRWPSSSPFFSRCWNPVRRNETMAAAPRTSGATASRRSGSCWARSPATAP